jgi:carbon-monoxide dehydrogenase medium subunit
MAMRLAAPSLLVDLNAVAGLGGITPDGSRRLRIGPMTRHCQLAAAGGEPLLATVAASIGHAAIRTRGTIGGSLAHADPNAEWPALALACDGELTATGPAGSRSITAGSFFRSLFETDLLDDEILTLVELERPSQWGFAELARRQGDFALVLALVARLDAGWRVVLGGVASTPVRCPEAEGALDGGERDPVAVSAAVAGSDRSAAFSDLHASARYRQAMATELTARAVAGLRSGVGGGERP